MRKSISVFLILVSPTVLLAEDFSTDQSGRFFHIARQGYEPANIETTGVGTDGSVGSYLTDGAFSYSTVPAYYNRNDLSVSGGDLVAPLPVISSEIEGNSGQYSRTFAIRVRDDFSDNGAHYSGDILGDLTGDTLHYRFAIDTNLAPGTPFTQNMLIGDVPDPSSTTGNVISGHPNDPRIEIVLFGNNGQSAYISETYGVNILTLDSGTFVNVDIPLVPSSFGNYYGGPVDPADFAATIADIEQVRFQFRSYFGTEGFGFDSDSGISSANFLLDYVQTAALPEPASLGALTLGALLVVRRRRA